MNNAGIIKVGITGQGGFIGTHLYNELGLFPDKYKRIHFEDNYFIETELLNNFVKQCDVIVHLAAVNRHLDHNELFRINVELVNKLINALEKEDVTPHIIFASSTQENLENQYGKSKLKGKQLFEKWAHDRRASFSGMIIPNVFGPFGLPNYNSFVATFCYKLTHNEKPEILTDSEVNLIYVSSLCKYIINDIDEMANIANSIVKNNHIQPDFTKKVSEILGLFTIFKDQYFDHGIIPDFLDINEINLFNTFRSYIDINSYFPFILKKHSDERGMFAETIKTKTGGQISFSTTKPEITRGNHYHTRKIERFTVLKGNAKIQLRKIGTEEVFEFYLDGEKPSHIDIPVWFTHNITNIGNENLYTQFWINEWYDEANTDTFFEVVKK